MGSLCEHLLLRERGVVSLVGAGGKTTLMFRLAEELAEAGERVLTTTTTRIFKPMEMEPTNLVVAADLRDVIRRAEECLAHHPHVTAAREDLTPAGKLAGFDPTGIARIWKTGLFRWILVEADGAAGRSLKAPAAHEPVVPGSSTLVVGIVGLDGVGRSLDGRHVFRPEIYSRLSGLPLGSPVTEESIASVIRHEEGLFKGCPAEAGRLVLLNKAENNHTRRAAERIASILHENGAGKIEKIVIGAVGNEPPKVEYYGP